MVLFVCLGGSQEHIIFDEGFKRQAHKGSKYRYQISGASSQARDFVDKLLTVSHSQRPLVSEMLNHEWLKMEASEPYLP